MAKIRITVNEQRIKDLLCDALEGGSNYWYFIKSFNFPEGKTKHDFQYPHLDLPFTETGSLLITDIENPKFAGKLLDKKACLKGLQIMANKHPRHFGDFISENDDSTTGDVFLQCAILGDCIYG